MIRHRQIVETLLSRAGVTVGGTNPWDITVRDERFFARVLREKNLGLGETYIVENDLFLAFLDPYNQYSCASFDGTADLELAQREKLDLICRETALAKTDHVLYIGCGWGGFAKYAVETRGCTVTAVNISREQVRYAAEFCRGLPVRLIECDYREIHGRFDKIVSVGWWRTGTTWGRITTKLSWPGTATSKGLGRGSRRNTTRSSSACGNTTCSPAPAPSARAETRCGRSC